jgi:hypothetical protein
MALPQDQFQTRMTELLAKYKLPTASY